jgi:hypothetical protein
MYVDVKLNYGEKIKGAYAEEDADLEHLKANLLQKVTRRVLWRIGQSQYDPPRASGACLIKWKVLMQQMILEAGTKGGTRL